MTLYTLTLLVMVHMPNQYEKVFVAGDYASREKCIAAGHAINMAQNEAEMFTPLSFLCREKHHD